MYKRQALRESNRPRDEIFITDKYSTQLKLSDDPIAGLNISLKTLGLDYVDLYLLHSPFIKNGSTLEECWKQMEKLYKSGKAKNIGVSNFRVEDLEKILKIATIKPQINQIEFNAALQNQSPGIVKFCKENNIQLEAYTPCLLYTSWINLIGSIGGTNDENILLGIHTIHFCQ